MLASRLFHLRWQTNSSFDEGYGDILAGRGKKKKRVETLLTVFRCFIVKFSESFLISKGGRKQLKKISTKNGRNILISKLRTFSRFGYLQLRGGLKKALK